MTFSLFLSKIIVDCFKLFSNFFETIENLEKTFFFLKKKNFIFCKLLDFFQFFDFFLKLFEIFFNFILLTPKTFHFFNFSNFMTPENCGSLASVHGLVLRRCTCFFWFKSAKSVLRASLPAFLTVLARIGTSISSRAVGNSLPGLLWDSLSSPHACLLVVAARESTPRLDPGVCDCGPRVNGEPSASPSSGQILPVEAPVIWVCTCVTPCCTHGPLGLPL